MINLFLSMFNIALKVMSLFFSFSIDVDILDPPTTVPQVKYRTKIEQFLRGLVLTAHRVPFS
ncbi:hypothetical protein BN59_02756 [Legionella massiliensis]|uniref:Uncharacterized protein n=1 Tax=Legionella massiliensis TaxID=1034943 RepID=A0A078L005_9GAMM|nr:hypothetical protein BN59_02756 [Legionella massiliensis]CEE14184.1 hypothetical protein BN1094_02756 [Legionella massiliensis]